MQLSKLEVKIYHRKIKKAIYRAEYKNAATKLKDKFGNKKGTKIMALSNDARKKKDNK
jgi:UDP:flavonoid glycosyltransferase YjiC (YdhE family)